MGRTGPQYAAISKKEKAKAALLECDCVGGQKRKVLPTSTEDENVEGSM